MPLCESGALENTASAAADGWLHADGIDVTAVLDS